MEPEQVTHLPPPLPPQPTRGGHGKVGESSLAGADSCDASTGIGQSSPAMQQPGCSAACPTKQPRAACSERSDQDGVLNGFPDGGQPTGGLTSCSASGPSSSLETGEQAAHAWCCSFTPPGGAEVPDLKGCEPRPGGAADLHCENWAYALALPTQDPHQRPRQCQDAGQWEVGAEGRSAARSKGQQENLPSALSQTVGVPDWACEDLASSLDDLSVECLSADWEPNVSSLGSDSQTDWDQTDQEEEEEEEDYCYSDSFSSAADYRSCSASQEISGTSDPPRHAAGADGSVLVLGNLPLSDSFADFCTASTQASQDGSWAEFSQQGVEPSCRVQQLLLDSFPEKEQPAEEEGKKEQEQEEEVLSLGHHLPGDQKSEETRRFRPTFHSIQKGMWWLQQDPHSADGLRFHWGGSQSNRSLLRCLGVEAEHTGILEPTKDSMPVDCSLEHVAAAAAAAGTDAPPEHSDSSAPVADAAQVALSSSQPDWSRGRGLSSSTQDGTSPRRAPHFWGWK